MNVCFDPQHELHDYYATCAEALAEKVKDIDMARLELRRALEKS